MSKQNADEEKPEKENALLGFIKSAGNYSTIALIAATFLVNYGMFRADYSHLQQRIDELEQLKLDQVKWVSEIHEKRLDAVEIEQKAERDTVFEMKAKIDVIADWVKDQRDDHRREP